MTNQPKVDSPEWDPLKKGEVILSDADEYLWRQVHPRRVSAGIVSSEAFEPGRGDEKQLSCSRAATASQEQASKYHTVTLGLESAGCAQVTVADVEAVRPIIDGDPDVVAARAVDDSALATDAAPMPPGHTFIDLRPFGSSRITKKAKQLAFFAKRNGGLQVPRAPEKSAVLPLTASQEGES